MLVLLVTRAYVQMSWLRTVAAFALIPTASTLIAAAVFTAALQLHSSPAFNSVPDIFVHVSDIVWLPGFIFILALKHSVCAIPKTIRGDNDTILSSVVILFTIFWNSCVQLYNCCKSKGSAHIGYNVNRFENIAMNVAMIFFALCQYTGEDKQLCDMEMSAFVGNSSDDDEQWLIIITLYVWSVLLECVLWRQGRDVWLLAVDMLQIGLNICICYLANYLDTHDWKRGGIVVVIARILWDIKDLKDLYEEAHFVWKPRFDGAPGDRTILFVGNAGCGKSTLLNGIARSASSWCSCWLRPVFKSGCPAYTNVCTSTPPSHKLQGGIVLKDICGFGDFYTVEKAAQQVEDSFKSAGQFKICFVITTLPSGDIDESEFMPIQHVFKAVAGGLLLSSSDPCHYGIIINKASNKDVKNFRPIRRWCRRGWCPQGWCPQGCCTTSKSEDGVLMSKIYQGLQTHVHEFRRPPVTIVRKSRWLERTSRLVAPNLPRHLKHFIDELPPVSISPDEVTTVQFLNVVKDFRIARLVKENKELREQVQTLKDENKGLKNATKEERIPQRCERQNNGARALMSPLLTW